VVGLHASLPTGLIKIETNAYSSLDLVKESTLHCSVKLLGENL
jgi:hypothetical protein